MNRTKIICTIGPSSWDPRVLKQMIEAGMNCARVNGAFADIDELNKVTNLVRSISDEVALMMDVKGPEIRLNKFLNPITIQPGQTIVIGNDNASEIYPSNYIDLYKYIQVNQRIVIGDGETELIVKNIENKNIICEVVVGELLKPGKAMNLPGATYSSEILTQKDLVNLKHAINLGWDYVSASFVQSAESAKFIKTHLEDSNMKLIAKIEDQLGVDSVDEILNEVDGIMIARGGLGVELGVEMVPVVQRRLLEAAQKAGKIVITATQMLESMTYNPKPTRAEANDIATAIYLGTDAVMLSGESSSGKYPVEAVRYLSKIASVVETNLPSIVFNTNTKYEVKVDSFGKSIAMLANNLQDSLKAIVVYDDDGLLARMIARHFIKLPVYALVVKEFSVRHLAISKGVTKSITLDLQTQSNNDNSINHIIKRLEQLNILSKGDQILLATRNVNNNQEDLSVTITKI